MINRYHFSPVQPVMPRKSAALPRFGAAPMLPVGAGFAKGLFERQSSQELEKAFDDLVQALERDTYAGQRLQTHRAWSDNGKPLTNTWRLGLADATGETLIVLSAKPDTSFRRSHQYYDVELYMGLLEKGMPPLSPAAMEKLTKLAKLIEPRTDLTKLTSP